LLVRERTNLNVSLTTKLCEFIAAEVKSGRYRSGSEVVRAALRALQAPTQVAIPRVPGADAGSSPASTATVSSREMRYRAILESATDYAIIAFNLDRQIVEWNAGARALTGWSEAEMLGRDGTVIFTPEDRADDIPDQEMDRAAAEGRAVSERWHMRADGSRFWGSGLMMPIRDTSGALAGFLKIMQDRTQAHRLGHSLEASEARLRAVFEAVPVGILVAEAPSGRLVGSNPRLDQLFGTQWPRSGEIADYGAWECFHPDGKRVQAHEYPMARVLQGEERPTLEVLRRSDDDSRHWICITGAPIQDTGGAITGAVVSVEDIDEAKRTQASLRQANQLLSDVAIGNAADLQSSRRDLVGAETRREVAEHQVRQLQKMEAVGQLTGGIAHDFNNMLSVVISGLSLAQRRLERGDVAIGRYIEAAMDGARRAATLTHRLLAFSRQQALSPVSLDVNQMVQGMSDLLRRTLGEGIELEVVLAGGLWLTHADPSQLENALLNLAVNARDAMDGAGRLTIETANTHLDEAYARQHEEVEPGQYVLLAVTDIGAGMSSDVITRAFEPFFTTKVAGAGTGLGLSQVYGFVKQSAGHLKIYSEPGEGTTVKIYLPRFAGQLDTPFPLLPRTEMPSGRIEEVVLVVEDEARVRELAVATLRELGYTVIHADGAAAALRQLDAHPEVTLMFTDIVMPGMNGRLLADEALKRRPELRVLFTTGYTRNAVVHNGILDAGVDLLGKPYGVEQLAARVRAILDKP
jgi:PAS domain S-box-containing protein